MSRLLTIEEAWALARAKPLAKALDAAPAPQLADTPRDRRALRRKLSLLLAGHGDEGMPITALRDHVVKHGHKLVASALKDLGAEHENGRVRRGVPLPAKVTTKAPAKATKVVAPKPTAKAETKGQLAKAWRPLRFRGLE